MKLALYATLLIPFTLLTACERAATPPTPVVVTPAPVVVPAPVAVPGPAGPAGASGAQGEPGKPGASGEPGKPGDSTTVIVTPPAPSK